VALIRIRRWWFPRAGLYPPACILRTGAATGINQTNAVRQPSLR